MYKILRGISFRILKNFHYFFLYFIPNIFTRNMIFGSPVSVEQRVKVRGNGCVVIGEDCRFGSFIGGRNYGFSEFLVKYPDSKILFGNHIVTNNNLFICCANSVVIGSNTVIGEGVTIYDFDGHGLNADERKKIGVIGSVEIGSNVWIGTGVIILKNTIIGSNSIVAAGAVVNGSYPDNVIIGGVPARVIKEVPGI